MGDVADDMANGKSCLWCGIYFKKEHGFPVACTDCFEEATPHERRSIPKATNKEL